jgi:hypothetical protein
MWVTGLVHPTRSWILISNTAGLERILHFARGCPLELRKIEPINPTKGTLTHIRNCMVIVSSCTQLVNLQSFKDLSNFQLYFYFTG